VMIYTFLSARYANAEQTAAVAETAEAAAVLLSAIDTPIAWAALHAAGTPDPFVPPDPPPRLIAKTAIIRRATDEELATLAATLPTLPLRDRMLWENAEGGLVRVVDVEPLFVATVGAERAAALLA